jgi:eukaryotic-like serine/threonine-protein kinase
MATVYLAEDLRHSRRVALKVLRRELAGVIGAALFLTEIRTTANLQHPHILPLFDSGEVDGTVFYVMPLVEGESLRDRSRRGGPRERTGQDRSTYPCHLARGRDQSFPVRADRGGH